MSEELLAVDGDEITVDSGTDRRGLLGKAAIAAAVAAVAGVGVSKIAQAGVGNNVGMNQGAANTGVTLTTSIAGGSTFLVTDGGTVGPAAGVNPRVGSIFATQSVSSRAAIMGEATGTGYGWAVYGRNSSSQGIGVYGLNTGTGGVGLYGEHRAGTTELGTGVVGVSNSGVGVQGNGATFDVQAAGSGKVLLSANGVANPPAGASTVGTLAKDTAGNMWVCVASGTPGTWRRIAGPASAGAFHALSPGRVYDSRAAAPVQGTLAGGQNRTISVADKRDTTTGAVTTANFVPAGATAVAANVTIVSASGAGFLTANPGGTTTVDSSTINWSAAAQVLANGVTLTLNSTRELTIVAGGGGSTDFIVDIMGYYL